MTDLVSARTGTNEDVQVTAALARAAQVVVRDERGGQWHLDHDSAQVDPAEPHRAACAQPDRTLVVGCIDDVVVGYGLAVLSQAHNGDADPTHLCMIEELVVHPDARAIGVGSEILAEIRLWAIANDCAAIESQVLPGNRAAKNFFERVGMKTRKMRVSADL